MSDTGQHPVATETPVERTLNRIESKIDALKDNHGKLDKSVALLEASVATLAAANTAMDTRLRAVESMRSQAIGMGLAAGVLVPIILKALHL
jgi:prefoldin subunit 5